MFKVYKLTFMAERPPPPQLLQLEVVDNLIDSGMVLDECDDLHLAAASRTKQRIDFVDFSYHLGPIPVRDKWRLISNEK